MGCCLKRRSFLFNPNVEPEIYLDRQEVKAWLRTLLTRSLPIKIKIVALFHGTEGAGKTHFLKHVQWNLIRTGVPLVAYVDLRKTASEYDFYMRIVEALSKCGFIEDFLAEMSNLRDSKSINEMTGGVRLGWIGKQLDFNPQQIKLWIFGELPQTLGRWIISVREDADMSRTALSELLRAFYKMNERRYPVFLVDHIEDVLGDQPRNYMSRHSKEEATKHMRTLANYSSVIVALDHGDYASYKQLFPEFKLSDSEFELSFLRDDSLAEFLSELHTHVVDSTRLGEIDFATLHNGERVSSFSYPLTEESIAFMKALKTMQPGTILNILDKALKEVSEKSDETIITRSLIEKTARTLDPYSLVVCGNCGLHLMQINIDMLSKYDRPGTIVNVRCPACNVTVRPLLPLVLDRIVVDTSALVDSCVSTVFECLPDHGRSRRVTIYVPKAVRSELAHWEKKADKFSVSKSALNELRRIQELRLRGNVNIEDNVGRQPQVYEKVLAQFTDSIDRIITETAMALDATLFTQDNLMAENARATGVFSLLFRKTGDSGNMVRSLHNKGVSGQ